MRRQIANGPLADRRDLIGRPLQRWRVGGAIEEAERHLDLLRIPWHLGALGRLADAQPYTIEHIRQWQAAGADHFGQGLRVSAIWAGLAGDDRPRRGVESNQHVPCGIYEG